MLNYIRRWDIFEINVRQSHMDGTPNPFDRVNLESKNAQGL
jgi:hypothetical protein